MEGEGGREKSKKEQAMERAGEVGGQKRNRLELKKGTGLGGVLMEREIQKRNRLERRGRGGRIEKRNRLWRGVGRERLFGAVVGEEVLVGEAGGGGGGEAETAEFGEHGGLVDGGEDLLGFHEDE